MTPPLICGPSMPVAQRHAAYFLIVFAVTLVPSVTATAQERQILEEVRVIAQRREESAQATPISLASFNSDQLTTLGIQGIGDIGAKVPSFQVDSFPSSNQTLRLFIRGIGISDVQITQDPAVGVYLDGIYLARSTGLAADVADLERIEVLRGPQGTLYGRNTTGGALNLVTARPALNEWQFRQELGTGNRSRLHSKSVLNIPAADTVAVKLSALFEDLDGFVNNGGKGGDFGDRRTEGYRLDFHWQLGLNATLDYAWDKSRLESYNYSPQAVSPGILTGSPVDAAILSAQRFVTYSSERMKRMDTSTTLRPNDTNIDGHSLIVRWQKGPVSVQSLSAFRTLKDDSYIDFASGASREYRVDFQAITLGAQSDNPQRYDSVRTRLEQEQFSQELQIVLNHGPRWQAVMGLYFFEEDAKEDWFPVHHIFSFPVIETGDEGIAVNVRAEDNVIENRAFAAYGQITYSPRSMEERLHLSAGWRHSRDTRAVERSFHQDNYVDFGDSVIGPLESTDFEADAESDFIDNSFTLMAQWDWSDDLRLYAKAIEAYKSGGFNTRDPDPVFFEQGFDEEKNRTLELGFKGELLERSLRINSAIFYSEFDDYQLNFLIPTTISDTRVFNSGAATLSGLELEVTVFPLQDLLCQFSYAYLDAAIDDVSDPFSGEVRSFHFESAPRHTASVNLSYQFAPIQFGQPSVNINYNYVGARDRRDAVLYRDQYRLLNAELALADIPLALGQLRVSTWVKNALKEDYVMFNVDNLPHASRAVLWGETRTWGIDLRYDFD